MIAILSSLARYGYIAVPFRVFAEQMGLPIPAVPIPLAAGAIAVLSQSKDKRLATLQEAYP